MTEFPYMEMIFAVSHILLSCSMASLLIAPRLSARYMRRAGNAERSKSARCAIRITIASCMALILAVPASNGRHVPEAGVVHHLPKSPCLPGETHALYCRQTGGHLEDSRPRDAPPGRASGPARREFLNSYRGPARGRALEEKRTCKGECRRYSAKRPRTGSRYQAGQVRCQICDIWIDSRGAHTKDGEPAMQADTAWYCNCCQYRLRRVPRNSIYKPKKAGRPDPDLSYFNKHRALMLANLGRAIAETGGSAEQLDRRLPARMRAADIEYEFGSDIEEILEMARSEEPNKISLVAEFEAVRHRMKRVPAKHEMAAESRFSAEQYEAEFESWEHMLERLGYDPWYRKKDRVKKGRGREKPRHVMLGDDTDYMDIVRDGLKNEPVMAGLLDTVDAQIGTMDKRAVRRIALDVRLEGVGPRQQVLFES